jgi:general secretion pathway protein A
MSHRDTEKALSAEEFLSQEAPFGSPPAEVPPESEAHRASDLDSLDILAGETARPAPPEPTAQTNDESDFLSYYGLGQLPFADSVDPHYFFRTNSHEEAIVRLSLAIRHNISLALVTGASGTGKTLVSQLVLQQLDADQYKPALVLVTPGMGKTALLLEILAELGLPGAEGAVPRTRDLLKHLHDAVIDLYQQGKRLVIFLDECHFLSADCLHMVRTISNLEIPERKLSTCLLFGETRFLARLQHPSYDSLRNRIYFRAELPGLGPEDCAQYVKFRLMVAGRMDELFDAGALALVHESTGGIGRRVNKLCTLSLLEGFLRRRPVIDAGVVAACTAGL